MEKDPHCNRFFFKEAARQQRLFRPHLGLYQLAEVEKRGPSQRCPNYAYNFGKYLVKRLGDNQPNRLDYIENNKISVDYGAHYSIIVGT